MFIAFEVVLPGFKGLNNSLKLTILGFIAGFSKNHFFEKKNLI